MKLAKSQVDIGLSTNNIQELLGFWQYTVGLRLDHVLPVRRGQTQHRHDALGAVVKINHHLERLPAAPRSGYRELIIARKTSSKAESFADPDGNLVSLVPAGHQGVSQVGIRIAVRDLAVHRHFYAKVLGLAEESRPEGAAFRAGEFLIILEQQAETSENPGIRGIGSRYITFQVFKVDEIHAAALGAGAREGLAPVTLGSTARISMIVDPDGNWIELSQRASIVGGLE
jgi:lactoylglutathione lyase